MSTRYLKTLTDMLTAWSIVSPLGLIAAAYVALVRLLRYQRAQKLASDFGSKKRQLSSMTTKEAFHIMTQLQELEFPSSMSKARKIALLKVGAYCTNLTEHHH